MLSSTAWAQSGRRLPVAPNKVSAETMKLLRAYGVRKQYCCQLRRHCFGGPVDGSAVCRQLGGTPYRNSVCVNIAPPGGNPVGECQDP
jgi:hypothetical protein